MYTYRIFWGLIPPCMNRHSCVTEFHIFTEPKRYVPGYLYIPSDAPFKSETWGSLPTVSDSFRYQVLQWMLTTWDFVVSYTSARMQLPMTALLDWKHLAVHRTFKLNSHVETNNEIEPVKLVDTLSHQSQVERHLWIQSVSWDSSFPGTAAWCQSGKSGTMFARVGISAAPGS